ncbi:MAG TPA: biotin/lipoyl-binding protein, partial [Dissulfurispiraceae bacterium]|nr:biotin/lipoyl-binding protein [Dissulfurispiraceae bacterium]
MNILLALLLLLPGCGSGSKDKTVKAPVVPVLVAESVRKDMPVQLRAIGTVEAFSTVSVRAQAGGQLARIHFREGQDVKKGDLLFTIDPRPFESALTQAEANLARDAAQMENARQEAKRYEELV